MTLLNHFEPARFWALLKLQLARSRKGVTMTFLIVFNLLFFVSMLLNLYVEPAQKVFTHYGDFTSSLLITGFILSSLAFRDLGHPLKRYHFLALPASAFEKFLSQWLLTSLGWTCLYTVAFTLYTWLANPLGQLLFPEVDFQPFNPLNPKAVSAIQFYLVLQSLFLLGSVQFRGYAFAKTIGVISVFTGLCLLAAYFIMKELFLSPHECHGYHCEYFDHFSHHWIWLVAKVLFWWLLAPLSWFITFLAIREKEV